MNVDSILISDYANTIAGKLTVLGVFNRIGPTQVPVQIPQMSVSLVIHGPHSEAGKAHEGEIRLINARREVMANMPCSFRFTSDNLLAGIPLRQIITQTIFLPVFPEAGPYAFEVYFDGTYHATASFVVVGPEA